MKKLSLVLAASLLMFPVMKGRGNVSFDAGNMSGEEFAVAITAARLLASILIVDAVGSIMGGLKVLKDDDGKLTLSNFKATKAAAREGAYYGYMSGGVLGFGIGYSIGANIAVLNPVNQSPLARLFTYIVCAGTGGLIGTGVGALSGAVVGGYAGGQTGTVIAALKAIIAPDENEPVKEVAVEVSSDVAVAHDSELTVVAN